MITLTCDEAELGEHLYYAHLSAQVALNPAPHTAPADIQWVELPEDQRQLWQATASRLVALHRASEGQR